MVISITKYQAIDNSIFDTEQEALEYEKILTATPYEQLMDFFKKHELKKCNIFDIDNCHFFQYPIICVKEEEVYVLTTLLYRVNIVGNPYYEHITYDEYCEEIPVANYYVWREIDKNNIVVYPLKQLIKNLNSSVINLLEGVTL